MSIRKRATTRALPEYRKNEDLENLLVFGYQCKLFHDDERASYIDAGRHLIPWMGDSSILIDRYDGRGHLHDIRPYDAQNFTEQQIELSPEEKAIEQLCEEERYLEMHVDMAEKEVYEEEELKRLNEALEADNGYSAVGFNYDQSGAANEVQDNKEGDEQENNDDEDDTDDPYVPIPELQVPTTVTPPATMKQHAIIEKTASFTSKQGVQMEIVIKTKQQNNPLFSFLNYDDELNAYYRHVLNAIRKGRYIPKPTEKRQSESENDSGYLHPSLVKKSDDHIETAASRQEFLSSVSSKLPAGQIANTPYAKLLSNLSKHRASPDPNLSSSEKNKNLKGSSSDPSMVADRTASEDEEFTTAPGQPPPPGLGPPEPLPSQPNHPPVAHHASMAKTSASSQSVITPPPGVRPVINRMAEYVARNGPEFEVIVKVKRDDKFQFLEAWHPYHAYYTSQKNHLLKGMKKENGGDGDKLEDNGDSNSNRGVSFSIKTKESEPTSAGTFKPTALPYESSGEEGDEDEGTARKMAAMSQPAVVTPQASGLTTQPVSVPQSNSPQPEARASKSQSAEDKLRDRISAAARDKLAQAGKEKQIQAERKKKAALFITMLNRAKVAASSGSNAAENTGTRSSPQAQENTRGSSPSVSSTHHHSKSSPMLREAEYSNQNASRSCSKSPMTHSSSRSSPIRRTSSSASLLYAHRSSPERSRSRSISRSKRSESPRHSRRRSRSRTRHSKKKSSRHRSRSDSRKSSKARRRRRSGSRHRSRAHHRSKRSRSRSPRKRSRSSKSKRKRRDDSGSSSPSSKPKFVAIPELPESEKTKRSQDKMSSSSGSSRDSSPGVHDVARDKVKAECSEEGVLSSSDTNSQDTQACSSSQPSVFSAKPSTLAASFAKVPPAAPPSVTPTAPPTVSLSAQPSSAPKVSADLMSKVRAMLKASRQAVLEEEKQELRVPTPQSIVTRHEEGEDSSNSSTS